MLYSAWLYVCTEGGGNKKLFRRAIRGNEVDLVRRIEVESGLWIHLLSSKVLTEEQLELCRSEVFCSIIFAPWKLLVIISIYSAIMDICQPSDQAIWVWPVACLWGGWNLAWRSAPPCQMSPHRCNEKGIYKIWKIYWNFTKFRNINAPVAYPLKVICNGFSQNWWKVVSSCLLQYKAVCVINFDKLRSKMLKSRSLVVSLV